MGPVLKDLQEVLDDRNVTVCRELTRLHQEAFRGTLSEASEHFNEPRGEFVLLVAGEAGANGGSWSREVW